MYVFKVFLIGLIYLGASCMNDGIDGKDNELILKGVGIIEASCLGYYFFALKVKCLSCSHRMFKDAHKCGTCQTKYTHSYEESYEPWSDYFERVAPLKSLALNKPAVYIISIVLIALLYQFFSMWRHFWELPTLVIYVSLLTSLSGFLGSDGRASCWKNLHADINKID